METHKHGQGLQIALAITALTLMVELAGGIFSHSLALIADAGHVLTDLAALAIALYAARQAHRPSNQSRTFGYHRVGILVAAFNATTLIAVGVYIAVEAYGRILHPHAIQTLPMILAASFGLGANLYILTALHGHDAHDLNSRGAVLHVIGDAGAAVGVIIAGLIIALTGWTLADPLLSMAIAVLIGVGAYRLLADALHILMEAPPRHVNMEALIEAMTTVTGVIDIHDLHVWSIDSGKSMLSCHVRIEDQSLTDCLSIVNQLQHIISSDFAIQHATIQPETNGCMTNDLFCQLSSATSRHMHATLA